jgi:hypothetical protein
VSLPVAACCRFKQPACWQGFEKTGDLTETWLIPRGSVGVRMKKVGSVHILWAKDVVEIMMPIPSKIGGSGSAQKLQSRDGADRSLPTHHIDRVSLCRVF